LVGEELGDSRIACDSVLELEYVVAFVFED